MTTRGAAYGLIIESAFELPGLAPAAGPPELLIHPRGAPPPAASWVAHPSEPALAHDPALGYLRLRQALAGAWVEFVLSPREVWFATSEGAPERSVAAQLLGAVMGLVLRLRGRSVLHASAVAVDGRAIVVAGAKGAGKSTLSAALLAAGTLIADDLVVARADGAIEVGVGSLRLRPDAARALELRYDGLEPLWRQYEAAAVGLDKRSLSAAPCAAPVPLGLIALLEPDAGATSTRLERVPPREAALELVRHGYARHVCDAALAARDLASWADWARRVPVVRVVRPLGDAGLDELAGLARSLRERLGAAP